MARGVFQDLNTASMPPQSWSMGSEGRSLPVSFLTFSFMDATSFWRSAAVRSVSNLTFFRFFIFSSSSSSTWESAPMTTSEYICTNLR